MKTVFRSLTFKRINSKATVRSLPFQESWVMSMNAGELLWNELKTEGQTSLPIGAINQDPLENFNSTVRSCGGNRRNPTCDEFESAFSTCLVNTLTATSKKTNCQADNNDLLIDLRNLFDAEDEDDAEDGRVSQEGSFESSSSVNTSSSSISLGNQDGESSPESSLGTEGVKKLALTLLHKLRAATEFCDLCQAAMLFLGFDEFLLSPLQVCPPELQVFLCKIEEMFTIGRNLLPEVLKGENVFKTYKEAISTVSLSDLVFCASHDDMAKSTILEAVS